MLALGWGAISRRRLAGRNLRLIEFKDPDRRFIETPAGVSYAVLDNGACAQPRPCRRAGDGRYNGALARGAGRRRRLSAGRRRGGSGVAYYPPVSAPATPRTWVLPIFRSIVPRASSTSQTHQCLSAAGSQAVPPVENLCSCAGKRNRRTTDFLTLPTTSPPLRPPRASGSPIRSAGLSVRR